MVSIADAGNKEKTKDFLFNYCVFEDRTEISYSDLLLESDLFLHCDAINKDTNGTNGFDNTPLRAPLCPVLFTVVSDDDVFPETDCQLRAPDYLGIVAVRLNISHNDWLCLHPVLANMKHLVVSTESLLTVCNTNTS